MRLNLALGCALLTACVGAPAYANMCRIDSGATCPSAMPLGGYCECNVGGVNMGGTIIGQGYTRGSANSFQPGAPNGSPGQNLGEAVPPPPSYVPPGYGQQSYAAPPSYPPPAYPPQGN
jgi:hypothetical protein